MSRAALRVVEQGVVQGHGGVDVWEQRAKVMNEGNGSKWQQIYNVVGGICTIWSLPG